MKFRFGSAFLAGFIFAGGQALSALAGGAVAEEITLVDDIDREPVKAVLCPTGQDFNWISVRVVHAALGDTDTSCATDQVDLHDLGDIPQSLNQAAMGQDSDQTFGPDTVFASNDFDMTSPLDGATTLGDTLERGQF